MITKNPSREEVRNVEGVLLGLDIGALSASTTTRYDMAERQPTWAKYLPFNSVTINNNSNSNLTFAINQDSTKAVLIPAKTIKTITGHAIWSFYISTDITAVTSGQLTFDFERVGMIPDSFTKAISKNVFFKALLGV